MDRKRLSRELRAAREGEARIARWAGYGEILLAGAILLALVMVLLRIV
ncbi:hypothetical protein [Limibacillus halophilus]